MLYTGGGIATASACDGCDRSVALSGAATPKTLSKGKVSWAAGHRGTTGVDIYSAFSSDAGTIVSRS